MYVRLVRYVVGRINKVWSSGNELPLSPAVLLARPSRSLQDHAFQLYEQITSRAILTLNEHRPIRVTSDLWTCQRMIFCYFKPFHPPSAGRDNGNDFAKFCP